MLCYGHDAINKTVFLVIVLAGESGEGARDDAIKLNAEVDFDDGIEDRSTWTDPTAWGLLQFRTRDRFLSDLSVPKMSSQDKAVQDAKKTAISYATDWGSKYTLLCSRNTSTFPIPY